MEKSERNRYLVKNTIIFALGNFGMKVISFLLVPLYTNILTTQEYGIVDLIYTISTVLVPLLTLNVGEAVMRFALDKDADNDKIMSVGLSMMTVATVIGVCVIPVSRWIDSISSYSIFIYLYMISLGYSQILLCYLRGREMLVAYSIGNIIQSLLIAVLNVIFLLGLKIGIKGYLTAYILANFITALYGFYIGKVYKVIKNYTFDILLSKQMLTYSIVLIPNSFMWWLMNSSDRIMVTGMIGAAANGIYAVSYKLPTLLSTLTTIFTQAWSYSAIREDDSEDKEEYTNKIYNNMVMVVVTVAAGLLFIIKIFLKYYVQESYYEAWRYTPYLIIGFVFMTLGTFISTPYTVHKDSIGMLKSAVCGAMINIVLNWLLIPRIGISGAAFATGISYIVVYLYRVWDTRKYLRIKCLRKNHIMSYALLVIMSVTMYLNLRMENFVLLVEFIIVIVINKDFILNIITTIRRKVNKYE